MRDDELVDRLIHSQDREEREALLQQCLERAKKSTGIVASLLPHLRNGEPEEQQYVMHVLRAIGPAGDAALPELASLLAAQTTAPEVSDDIGLTMGYLGAASVEYFRALLQNHSARELVQEQVASGLVELLLGDSAKFHGVEGVEAELLWLLEHGSPQSRSTVTGFLSDPSAADVDPETLVERRVLPFLKVHLQHRSKRVRVAVAHATVLLQPGCSDAWRVVVDAIEDADEIVRIDAITAFEKSLGDIEFLDDGTADDNADGTPTFVARETFPTDQETRRRLIALASDPNSQIRAEVAPVLGALKSFPDEVLPPLMALLDDPDDLVVGGAILAVAELGSAARDALPKLLALAARDFAYHDEAADVADHIAGL